MSEEKAKSAALEFVKSRVKFYSQDPTYVADSYEYTYQFIEGKLEKKDWEFLINISHSGLNETRSALVRIGLDSRTGEVVSFDQIRQEESFK